MGSFSPIIPLENKQKDDFVICFGVGLFIATEISRKIPCSAVRSCQGASLEKSPQQPKVPEQLSQQPHLSWNVVGSLWLFQCGLCFWSGKETKQPSCFLQTQFKTKSVAKYIQGCISGNQSGHYVLVQSHCSSSAHVTPSWVWHDGSRSRFFKSCWMAETTISTRTVLVNFDDQFAPTSKAIPVFVGFSCIFSPLSLSLIGLLQRINYSGSLCFVEPFTVLNGFTQADKKNMLGNHIILGAAHLPRLGATHNPQPRER